MNVIPLASSENMPMSTLSERATRIRGLVNAARICIIEVGRELVAAKAEVPHGEWLPWLKKEFGWPARTAQGYMQVAEAFQMREARVFADLKIEATALYLLAGPEVPESAREQAVAAAEAGQKVTKEKAEEMVKEAVKIAVTRALKSAESEHEEKIAAATAEAERKWKDDAGQLKSELEKIQAQYKGTPGIPTYLAVTKRALGVKKLSPEHLALVAQLLGHCIVVGDERYEPLSKEQLARNSEYLRLTGEVCEAMQSLAGAPPPAALLAACYPVQRALIRERIGAVEKWLEECRAALPQYENERI